MNHSRDIFAILNIAPNLLFKLNETGGVLKYRITENLEVESSKIDSDNAWSTSAVSLNELLCGKYTIQKIVNPNVNEAIAINYAKACGYNWIAMDEDRKIYAFKSKPKKNSKEWVHSKLGFEESLPINIPISFISWNDNEPHYIGGE